MSKAAAPLSLETFAAALDRLGAPRRYLVAVSGGADSMALARLSALHMRSGAADVVAVTVDHGLRPESAGEARIVAGWCEAAGLDHQIIKWRGDKPQTGVQAAARAARYRLLCEAATAGGFDAILTAHTADDQSETVFMRLARGAGPRGLAGMAAERLIAAGAGEPVRLLRPLLAFKREEIAATLEAFEQPHLDDPSNDDPAFERVRTRALLGALEEQGLLTRGALLQTAKRARAAATRLDAADEAAFAAAAGDFDPAGFVSLDLPDIPPSLVARLIFAVSGDEYPPGEEDAAAALAQAANAGTATLGGAMLKARGGRLWAFREPAAVLGRAGVSPLAPAPLGPGERRLWDARFIVENVGETPLSVTPAGADGGEADPGPAPLEAQAGRPAASPAEAAGFRVHSLAEERYYDRVQRFH